MSKEVCWLFKLFQLIVISLNQHCGYVDMQSRGWIQEIFWKLKLWEFMLEWRRWGMNERWLRCFYNERLVDDGIEELGNTRKTSFIVERISSVLDILTTSIYEISQMEMFRNLSLGAVAIRNVHYCGQFLKEFIWAKLSVYAGMKDLKCSTE